jgi:hypothetical protein
MFAFAHQLGFHLARPSQYLKRDQPRTNKYEHNKMKINKIGLI